MRKRYCTKCGGPIEKGQPYHITKRGRHHRNCPKQRMPPIITLLPHIYPDVDD